jgi:ATP/maltotriose-dependent transcriptional regulator MalT
MLAGRPDLAELELAAGLQRLSTVSDTDSGLLATTTAMLAQAVCAQGRTREAAELCDATDARVAPDDNVTRAISAGVRARVLARDGDCGAAEARARDAISLLADSDLLWHRGDALLDLAEVLATCGRPQESQEAVELALELYESKGNLAAANRARSLLSAPKGE